MPEGTPDVKGAPGHPSTMRYVPRLGVFSGTMMVVGGIIGSGIFLNPAIVAARVGTTELTLLVWVAGGVVALAGALIFAELGARRPVAGGGYVYLRDAFGRLPAFLYGWTLLLVISTGAIAAVAVTFANYTAALLGLAAGFRVPLAIGAIVALSALNYVGVKPGAITQNVLTVLKLGALMFLILSGVLLSVETPVDMLPAATQRNVAVALGAALVPVLFAFGGWQQTNFVAEELIDPRRNLPRALIAGVVVVVAVYLLANLAYLKTLGVAGLASSTAPAADAMNALFGAEGRTLIAAGIAVSTFGFLNLVILVSPRVYHAMAGDGLFLPQLARLHPRYRTPAGAIVFQAGWAIALTSTGTYADLLDYVVFGDWIFFGLTAAAVFVFRSREGGVEESRDVRFQMPGYPVTPLLFIGAALYVVAGSIVSNPGNAMRGTLLIGLGLPVYWYWERRQNRQSPRRPPHPPGTPHGTS